MTVYLKPGDLASWLALPPLRKLMDARSIVVTLQPLLGSLGNIASSNVKPGESDPLEAYRARRAKARSAAARRERQRMCEMLGIGEQAGHRQIDPLVLALGLLWANKTAPDRSLDYLETAFSKTFIEAANVESIDAVAVFLEEMGIPADRFGESFFEDAGPLQEMQAGLLETGILSAPAFVLDGEIFLGREHLPLITWMLEGKRGAPAV